MTKPLRNLESLPKSLDDHIWSDYIELLCLVNIDRVVSKSDILDRVRERKDLGGEVDDLSDEIMATSSLDNDPSSAEIDDEWTVRVDDWFTHLEYRSSVFEDFYPFTFSKSESLLCRRTNIDSKHKLYIFLLLLSDLRRIGKDTNFLTNSFEIISWTALQKCLPENAQVHVFSRNPLGDDRYKGNIWNKINKLAKDIGETLKITQKEFSPYDNADKGLDIVGWVPTGDNVDGLLLVFGQCACTADWPNKQFSSSALNWQAYMPLKAPPSNMVFVPFCFRNSDGTWCREREIRGSILVDRPRLIYLLKNSYLSLETLPCYNFVNEVLDQRESLF